MSTVLQRRNGGWIATNPRFDSFVKGVFEDMDRAFEGLGTMTRGNLPVALWEDETAYHVEAEVPGVAESDIEATVHEGVLTIRFERKAEEGRTYRFNSRHFGRFERTFALPDTVDTENVQAELRDGILRLTLPKVPAAQPRRIAIQAIQAQ